MVLGFDDLMHEQDRAPRPPVPSPTSSLARLRRRSRWRIAAISGASFLALLGFEAARLHNGHDPALARSSTGATSTQSQATQGQSQSQDQSSSSNGNDDSSGQSYYTPPSSDPPVTSSS